MLIKKRPIIGNGGYIAWFLGSGLIGLFLIWKKPDRLWSTTKIPNPQFCSKGVVVIHEKARRYLSHPPADTVTKTVTAAAGDAQKPLHFAPARGPQETIYYLVTMRRFGRSRGIEWNFLHRRMSVWKFRASFRIGVFAPCPDQGWIVLMTRCGQCLDLPKFCLISGVIWVNNWGFVTQNDIIGRRLLRVIS